LSMGRIDSKFTKYPPTVTQPGRYTFQQIKERETRFGRTLISTVTNSKDERFSFFIPYPAEVSDKSLLARLTKAFGDDTEQWLGRKIDVTFDRYGRRRIEPTAR